MSRLACILLLAAAACETVDKGLETVGLKSKVESETGVSTDPVVKAAKALSKSFEEITPEQEYFIGRAVAAEILAREAVLEDDAATAYVNRVGQTVAQASLRPEVFGGYHVILLESDEVNALAAPGAFLFVTRGLLRRCKTEDELAAVLSHEVIHIERQDGIRMIRQSERFQALVDLGLEEALQSGDVGVLRDALDKIASELATTLLTHGYSRAIESEADVIAAAAHGINKFDEIFRFARVGVMIWKVSIDLAIQLGHVRAEASKQFRRVRPGDAITAIDGDAQFAGQFYVTDNTIEIRAAYVFDANPSGFRRLR